MAGWSILSDGSSLDCIQILHNLQITGFCLGRSKDQTLPHLFDQFLSLFLQEIYQKQEIRPIPAMLGDGQSVDLFKLYWVVREKGGYDSVTKNGSWGAVAEEAGLGPDVGSAVKLIYVKYLYELDRWLQRTLEQKLSVGMEKEIKGMLCGALDRKRNDQDFTEAVLERSNAVLTPISGDRSASENAIQLSEKICVIDVDDDNEDTVVVLGRSNAVLTPVSGDRPASENAIQLSEKICVIDVDDDNEDTVVVLDSNVAKEDRDLSSVKRKRESNCLGAFGLAEKSCVVVDGDGDDEKVVVLDSDVTKGDKNLSLSKRKRKDDSLLRLLDWINWIAKNPGDPIIWERSRREARAFKEYWAEAVAARDSLLLGRHCHLSGTGSVLQKKKRVCPSMYEDNINDNHQARGRLRSSQRLLSLREKSHSDSCLETLTDDDQFRIKVPVGPLFQAEVPDWSGVASGTSSYGSNDSDNSKWLGKMDWPLELKQESSIKTDLIGKGRPDSCRCRDSGSVQCVRFHVAEKRLQLKLELGSAFNVWRFDCMGEEVSLPWMDEDERRFKSIVQLNPPSLNRCFWDHIYKSFPSKSRQSLLSYYHNVFLLRRRSYQNRFTSNNIDSDDEESDFRLLGKSFGHNAVHVLGSKSVSGMRSKQRNNLSGSLRIK